MPNSGYTADPFDPMETDEKLFGLGSNDAGASLVSLIATFLHFYNSEMPYNLVLAATAEEEISGLNGVSAILELLPDISMGIVGEPTQMKLASAEKGLMVLDCVSRGVAGHAAREEGENAIYNAVSDIEWFRNYQFEEESSLLGPVKMTVSMIEAGQQHNVVPDTCAFVVDVRTTDSYTNSETLDIIRLHVQCSVLPRSMRLNPSGLDPDSILLQTASTLGIETFGSPTLSDQALMSFPTCKMGPGSSARSHSADEFIYLHEIKEGIEGYIAFLETLFELQPSAQ
jgi:acetylornithine deacetylase